MNPYKELDSKAFWRTAVADRSPFDLTDLWQPKFQILPKSRIVTFGSCFAQHISRFIKNQGFNWVNAEPAPSGVDSSLAEKFNYGVYSARTGNIYTTTLLLQWVKWALDEEPIPQVYWEKDKRYYDPFRPAIEPDGFASVDELFRMREVTVKAFRKCLTEANTFIFTLGLTESWYDTQENYEYAMCPGTVAGEFNEDRHAFRNLNFQECYSGLKTAIAMIRKVNKKMRFLLTVSPVPLTATKSGMHVLPATTYSKSVLRGVAGQLAGELKFVDYFPSYEVITSPVLGGMFYEPNKRSVNPAGVAFVMKQFGNALGIGSEPKPEISKTQKGSSVEQLPKSSKKKKSNDVCEEQLLEAFAPNKSI